MDENEIGKRVLDAAFKVHSALSPGLLEGVYEACLAHEPTKSNVRYGRQVALPVAYDGVVIDTALRLDLLVEERVVVEVKAAEKLLPVHSAQLLSYLRLGGLRLGYLLNFNVVHFRDGIKRIANGL